SDGVEFVTTEAATISGGTATLNVEARTAGEAGNTTAATQFTFVSPISGVNATATSNELSGGTDSETDESLRSRLLERMRKPPHGGSRSDYEQWALSQSGVTRVFVDEEEAGIGTVT